jgi:hypothetical protein
MDKVISSKTGKIEACSLMRDLHTVKMDGDIYAFNTEDIADGDCLLAEPRVGDRITIVKRRGLPPRVFISI